MSRASWSTPLGSSTKIISQISRCFHQTQTIWQHQIPVQTYRCTVDAEPLHRYRPGGYHPLALSDVLKDGRYKILHKLGWGGSSTTWAAKDQKDGRNVAVKVNVSKRKENNELKISQMLSALHARNPGKSHVNQMLDHFTLLGPNGSHDCLVLELVGPSVAGFVDAHCKDDRLPSKLAKRFAKQTLQGLDFLAANNIGHGDLHSGNIALEVPGLKFLRESDLLDELGEPEMGLVTRSDGKPLEANVPTHIVRPARFRTSTVLSSPSIKIIDFGEAFLNSNVPSTLHTPLSVRAPEVVFGDRLDLRVDLWSAGCLIFELITGQTPFDGIMLTASNLAQQMVELATDELPSRWQEKWLAIPEDKMSALDEEYTPQTWMRAVYFDNDKRAEFTEEEIARAAELIARLLKFEPSLRDTAEELLADAWFD